MARAKPIDSGPFFACHCIHVFGYSIPVGIFLYHVRILAYSHLFTVFQKQADRSKHQFFACSAVYVLASALLR